MTVRPTAPAHQPFLARGLNREEAARYVGISPTYFDTLVERGTMPKPKCIGARRVWDVRALDLAFDALPDAGAETGQWNSWDDR
jgi:predicted DNA-binding transcriptional regulator AlpA